MSGVTKDEAAKAVKEANNAHCVMSAGVVPGFVTLAVNTSFSVSAWGVEFRGPVAFQVGVEEYNAKHESAALYLLEFDKERLAEALGKARDGEGAGDSPTGAVGESEEESSFTGPLAIGGRLVEVDVPGRGWPLLVGEVPVWLAINEAERGENHELAKKIFSSCYTKRQRRARRPEIINKNVFMGTTKVEKTIFGDVNREERLRAEDYDGRDIPVSLKSCTLSLSVKAPIRESEGTQEESREIEQGDPIGDRVIPSSIQRFWYTSLISCAKDNPGIREFTGTDLLRKRGYKKTLRPGNAATMIEAANAIAELTETVIWVNTSTGEKEYGKNGKPIDSRITKMHIIEGSFSIERYNDGTVDFSVKLKPEDDNDVITAFPLYAYAEKKGQCIDVPSHVFEFSGCGKVTSEHRRVMDYICRQLKSKGLGNDLLLDTIMDRCDIPEGKDHRYRLRKAIEKLLDNWVSKGFIKGWEFTYSGRSVRGLSITPAEDVGVNGEIGGRAKGHTRELKGHTRESKGQTRELKNETKASFRR